MCQKAWNDPAGGRHGTMRCPACGRMVDGWGDGETFDWRAGHGFFLLISGRPDSGAVGIARRIYDMAIAWGESNNLPNPSAILAGQDVPGGATILFVTDAADRAGAVMEQGLLRALQSVAPVKLQAADPEQIRHWDQTTPKGILPPRFFPPAASLRAQTAAPPPVASPLPVLSPPIAAPPTPIAPPAAAPTPAPVTNAPTPKPAVPARPSQPVQPAAKSPPAGSSAVTPGDSGIISPPPVLTRTVPTAPQAKGPKRVAAVSPAALAARAPVPPKGPAKGKPAKTFKPKHKPTPAKETRPHLAPAPPPTALPSSIAHATLQPPRRRNWRGAAAFLAAFVLIGVPGGAALWLMYPPQYKGAATLRVVVAPSHFAVGQPPENQRRSVINVESALLTSPTVLDRVLQDPRIRQTAWFHPPARPWPQSRLQRPGPPQTRLRNGLALIAGPHADTVDLTFRAAEGADIPQVLAVVIDVYRASARQRFDPRVEAAYLKGHERLGELQRSIAEQESVINDLTVELGGADSETNRCKVKLDQTQDAIKAAAREMAILQFERGDVPGREGDALSSLARRQRRLQEDLVADQAAWNTAFRLNTSMLAAKRDLEKKRQDFLQVRTELDVLANQRTVYGYLEPAGNAPPAAAIRQADQRPWLLILVAAMALAAGRAASWALAGSSVVARRAAEVAWPGQTRVLAVLPDLMTRRAGELPSDATAALRAALGAELQQKAGAAVQLTAAADPQAKSALAVALATDLARASLRVLLVDADLRAGSVAQRLDLHGPRGLADVLAGRCGDVEGIIPGGPGSPDVLPAGQMPPGMASADLLAGAALADWLARWRRGWDLVLLDGPPVLGLADAGILSHQADRTLLVVARGCCRVGDVREALQQLRPGPDGCVDVVFLGGKV